MIARQWQIVRQLAHGGGSVRELAEQFNVTQRTIRRDLDHLTESGFKLTESVSKHGKKTWHIPNLIPRPDDA